MTLRLTVARSIEVLADRLADELARPLADPLTPELVAVPADGIRSWLTARLADRLGATDGVTDGANGSGAGDGVVANVRFVFPGGLVRRALGRSTPSDPWSVGPLTWAVHDVLHGDGARAASLGIDADLVRCRSIADLFDRYALHRPTMIRRWENGADVDQSNDPLPAHLRWQPTLWRALVERLGAPSDVAATAIDAAALAAGRLVPDVPERVFLVGLAGLPAPHLQVLAALANQVDVHVLAPAPSSAVWERLHQHSRAVPLVLPLARDRDETVALSAHPLGRTWGRAAREAHLLLVGTAVETDAVIDRTDVDAGVDAGVDADVDAGAGLDGDRDPPTLLARLQHDLRHDRPPPGAPAADAVGAVDAVDRRAVRAEHDRSVQWHTCHGAARQADVLRDAVAHLLEERVDEQAGESADGQDGRAPSRPRYEPRDITVLCPDVGAFAPLVDAAFRGDPAHGVPTIPLRVADRSLRQQNPVLDAAAALLDLLDGRFRVSQVLAFAGLEPVARRFGFGPAELEMLSAWAVATNVHWGADAAGQARVGLPDDLGAFTWRDGLDQLLVGAAMSDPAMAAAAGHVPADDATGAVRFGPGSTVPVSDVESDAVAVAGALADLVHELELAVRALTADTSADQWCRALGDAADALFHVDDVDSWQRRDLDVELAGFVSDAAVGDEPVTAEVPAAQLATLLADRLTGRPGRVRFGSGAVTLSSLTAQRGVPSPVVCLLGLDGDLGGGSGVAADDLMAMAPCVGDRDARGEVRAQLLDAVLAAGDRLLIFSNGADVRTNANVPAAVPLAELADVIDATVRPDGPSRPATRSLTIRHPRHPWAEANFVPGALADDRPWGFDRAACAAARARRAQGPEPALLPAPLDATDGDVVSLAEVVEAACNPARTLVNRRLGVTLPRDAVPPSDQLPLELDGLERWQVAVSQLGVRRASGAAWSDHHDVWEAAQRRSGAVPPLEAGRRALDTATGAVDELIEHLEAECGLLAYELPASVPIDVDLTDVDLAHDDPVPGGLTDGDRPDGRRADRPATASPRRLVGAVHGVAGDLVVDVSPSRVLADRVLAMWVRLAALSAADPRRTMRGVVIGRHATRKGMATHRLSLRGSHVTREVLDVVVDLHRRATCDLVPAFPRTMRCLHERDRKGASSAWSSDRGGEGHDEWIVMALGAVQLDALLAEPPRDDETWANAPSRIEQWSERIWGTFDRTAEWEVVT